MYNDLEDLTLGDLHEASSLIVVSDSLYHFDTLPAVTEGTASMERDISQTDAFKVLYDIPYYLNGYAVTPYITVIPTGGTATTQNTAQKTIAYADYPNGLTVKAGITATFQGEVFNCENTYAVTVTEEPEHAAIISQPVSCKVALGEYAEATVIADHAKKYQWYYVHEGTPYALTDNFVAMLDLQIEGYTSPTLRLAIDSVTREQFYCQVTGTDNTTVRTNRINFTFGDTPSVIGVSGGEYYAGSNVEFNMWAEYAEEITWYVVRRRSGNLQIYTLDEFAELTGCEYETSHRKIGKRLHNAKVTFKNGEENWAGKYTVGYELQNSLGKASLDLENLVPFTLSPVRPLVTRFIETQTCIEGENMTFTFEAEDMADAEWVFEKADDEGTMVAYSLDSIRALFPESSFSASVTAGTATLTVSNARSELYDYVLYANAIGISAPASAGMARLNVFKVLGDLNRDGEADSLDIAVLRKALLGMQPIDVENYDLNADEEVSLLDLVWLKKILA